MKTATRYLDGTYARANPDWHSSDAPWKASQAHRMLSRHGIVPQTVAEVGCGAGVTLKCLSVRYPNVTFRGYDISPQAIEMAQDMAGRNITYRLGSPGAGDFFDVLLAMDVLEHVEDYMGFVSVCKAQATFKLYHIPLDVHVSSVLRGTVTRDRYVIGHLHYFTAESALATLKDTGHEIIDSFYTASALALFRHHPSVKRAVANVPRWLVGLVSRAIAARLFGGYSLLVLCR